jgi:quercetin dioxygenase-like cupin family protein
MSATIPQNVLALIASIKAEYALAKINDDAIRREIQNVSALLEPPPPLTGQFVRNTHEVIRHVNAAFSRGDRSSQKLLNAIGPVTEFLPWRYNYPPREDAPDLGKHIAFAEIIGPDAPFYSESVCLGLTVLGPETFYPDHHHPAVELYYVLAGTAEWTLDGISQERTPGAYILHPSQAVHAMRTHVEPLLAVYTWSGSDVRTSSVYINAVRSDTGEHNVSKD